MPQNVWDINLDYESINAETTCFSSGSLIHPYPAKAMPNMVSDLLQIISKNYNIKNVLDPFCGSGTVGLESKLLGLDFYGSDLNPLAVLISKTKTLTIENKRYLQRNIEGLVASIKNGGYPTYPLLDFSNIDYWFKAENILELSHLKYAIDNFLKFKGKYKKVYALILLTAYSSTVRDVCLSRNGEFKLYRIPESEIKNWKVDTYLTYEKKLNNLFNLLTETSNQRYNSKAVIEQANAKKINYLRPKSIDLVLTSPPYGDSRSTVAYGQFSRLPIQCIGDLLKKYLDIQTVEANCDELLLGGKKSIIKNKDIIRESALSNSTSLRKLMNSIDETIMFETLNLNAIIKELRVLKEQADIQIISKNKLVINKLKSLVKKETEKIKKLGKKEYYIEVQKFFDFSNLSTSKAHRRRNLTTKLIDGLLASHENKLTSINKRRDEVLLFFIDLYNVFKETDRVLKPNGIQSWIIGNRTVLGEVNVPLSDILSEWFQAFNYSQLTSLARKYSFKRLPHHMNSALDRDQQISSMMEEYIIVYQK